MAEVTYAGFIGKTLDEYLTDLRNAHLAIDPAWSLEPSTPDGLKMAIDAEIFAILDESAREAYNSKDPNKAAGIQLDMIAALTGTTRIAGTPSTVTLNLTGTNGTLIPTGSLAEDINEVQWETTEDATIASGVAAVAAQAVEPGRTEAAAGSITRIISVTSGWQSVTNSAVATPGTDAETDSQLRLRRSATVAAAGNNQIDSMRGELLLTEGVRYAIVYENELAAPDSDGLPGHSIAAVVDGGTDADVAMSIYMKKNPGVTLHQAGTPVTESVTSPNFPEQTKEIKFGRPTYVDIVMAVTIINDGTLPETVEDEITAAIIAYATGTVEAYQSTYFNTVGFSIGESVAISRLYTPVNQIMGSYGASYIDSLTLNGDTVNIPIAFDAISRWTEANITITVP